MEEAAAADMSGIGPPSPPSRRASLELRQSAFPVPQHQEEKKSEVDEDGPPPLPPGVVFHPRIVRPSTAIVGAARSNSLVLRSERESHAAFDGAIMAHDTHTSAEKRLSSLPDASGTNPLHAAAAGGGGSGDGGVGGTPSKWATLRNDIKGGPKLAYGRGSQSQVSSPINRQARVVSVVNAFVESTVGRRARYCQTNTLFNGIFYPGTIVKKRNFAHRTEYNIIFYNGIGSSKGVLGKAIVSKKEKRDRSSSRGLSVSARESEVFDLDETSDSTTFFDRIWDCFRTQDDEECYTDEIKRFEVLEEGQHVKTWHDDSASHNGEESSYNNESKWRPGKIVRVYEDGSADVEYDVSSKISEDRSTREICVPREIIKKDSDSNSDLRLDIALTPLLHVLVLVNYHGKGRPYLGRIKKVHRDGTFDVQYDESLLEAGVRLSHIRPVPKKTRIRHKGDQNWTEVTLQDYVEKRFPDQDFKVRKRNVCLKWIMKLCNVQTYQHHTNVAINLTSKDWEGLHLSGQYVTEKTFSRMSQLNRWVHLPPSIYGYFLHTAMETGTYEKQESYLVYLSFCAMCFFLQMTLLFCLWNSLPLFNDELNSGFCVNISILQVSTVIVFVMTVIEKLGDIITEYYLVLGSTRIAQTCDFEEAGEGASGGRHYYIVDLPSQGTSMKFLKCLVVTAELVIWLSLIAVGVKYILVQANVSNILQAAVSINFINDISLMLYNVLAPKVSLQVLQDELFEIRRLSIPGRKTSITIIFFVVCIIVALRQNRCHTWALSEF